MIVVFLDSRKTFGRLYCCMNPPCVAACAQEVRCRVRTKCAVVRLPIALPEKSWDTADHETLLHNRGCRMETPMSNTGMATDARKGGMIKWCRFHRAVRTRRSWRGCVVWNPSSFYNFRIQRRALIPSAQFTQPLVCA